MTIESNDELRDMVRASIAKLARTVQDAPQAPVRHASHGLLPLARGDDGDGACLIEPAVRCNHCGYCISYGH
jgi:hypothetical protein